MLDKINQYDSEGKEHGYWESYWNKGKFRYQGCYNKGVRVGLWKLRYSDISEKIHTLFYAD